MLPKLHVKLPMHLVCLPEASKRNFETKNPCFQKKEKKKNLHFFWSLRRGMIDYLCNLGPYA